MFNDIPEQANRLSKIMYKNHIYAAVFDVVNPERLKERVALYAFKKLKETNNLHLVDEYMDCRWKCYDTPKYEKFREFREDLWERARKEAIH